MMGEKKPKSALWESYHSFGVVFPIFLRKKPPIKSAKSCIARISGLEPCYDILTKGGRTEGTVFFQ